MAHSSENSIPNIMDFYLQTGDLIQKYMKELSVIFLLIAVPTNLIMILLGEKIDTLVTSHFDMPFEDLKASIGLWKFWEPLTPLFGYLFLMVLTLSLVVLFLNIVVLVFLEERKRYDLFTWQRAFKNALKKTIPTIWVNIIATICILLSFFLFVVPAILLEVYFHFPVIFIVLSFFLFVIPVIIVGVYFTFATYAVVCSDKTGKQALQHSYSLVKGHWWKILGYILLIEIVGIIIESTMEAPLNFIFYFGQLEMLKKFITNMVTDAYALFGMIYFYLVYKAWERKSEGNVGMSDESKVLAV